MNNTLSPWVIAIVLIAYFAILMLISFLTSKNATSDSFFTGNKQSPWYLVAFGMIGASLSGVTFISVPGKVASEGMAYFQIVLGYVIGYIVIAQVLMPLYYRLNVTSIYQYLATRFGVVSYKTGASFFILSRTLGSATRLYLATEVLHLFLFGDLGVPYWLTALTTVALIWIYTFKGGIKTIVYTDTFQTVFLISAVIICTIIISSALGVNWSGLYHKITESKTTGGYSMSRIFFFDDPNSPLYFYKQFFGGMFLAIAMTGLDQDLMQKNLTCKSIGEAKKNMYSFTTVLVVTNFLFLLLGGALYVYANHYQIDLPVKTDHTFPTLALNNFGKVAGIFFLLGITASSYASADSALAALTTGFCIDFLHFERRNESQKQQYKLMVHIGFSILFLLIILATKYYVDAHPKTDLIGLILTIAGYTYGPLLGLFTFGIVLKRKLHEKLVPIVCVLIPVICFIISKYSQAWTGGVLQPDGKYLGGYIFGNELLILNGLLTFIGLWIISKKGSNTVSHVQTVQV
ncbi:sodium:solute symporter [Fluviicola taffensis]|uniref:Na+/solute symporter n=1 Tax=Fluviicola taffensis (strain DSM 16823 / NCIMB 13979 / RW262) TaxID=755732 RepID=F2IDI8_FLUTR|nr:sodium:solute symporter [Fluviicola taffensis]AEA42364.1 Na+/solute symporter [Fluviicola taffensis DSM 16823]